MIFRRMRKSFPVFFAKMVVFFHLNRDARSRLIGTLGVDLSRPSVAIFRVRASRFCYLDMATFPIPTWQDFRLRRGKKFAFDMAPFSHLK